jgi:4-methylaminobutanoate oxidase (formaldehyde-forming)
VRVPGDGRRRLRKIINGPEAFTPDNEFLLGETDVDGFFVAAGFCAARHRRARAAVGKVMAEWIVSGRPGMDLWHMDVRGSDGSTAPRRTRC